MPWTFYALWAVAIYCLAQAYRDFRRKDYGWGIIGVAAAVVILLLPISSHAVRIDLPQAPAP